MVKISVVDQPIQSVVKDGKIVLRSKLSPGEDPDRLGTGKYAETLAKYIRDCDTPMTIGIQGEWGSGKTSLLNMIREEIEETQWNRGRGTFRGSDQYKTIWVNTWEHSLMKSPEECLLSIVEEIIEEIALVDGSYKSAERAKKALAGLAQGALKIGASMAFGNTGASVAEELVSGRSANKVKELRQSLETIVETVVRRDQNKLDRFVVFIDDLDRLEPTVAVLVLELLKNIFTIKNCVFVLAIDYQVVVKGLKGKFGEQTEDNEWEFRAFFDKIIQLPFMMPMATYDLKRYIHAHLLDIQYFKPTEKKTLLDDGRLARVVILTLGHNPRSMKRLLNALSLIKLHNGEDFEDVHLRQLIFALVCCQISFPRVFELLPREPDFAQWDDEFVDRIAGPSDEDRRLLQALEHATQMNDEDFDEVWEQALFKILWRKAWDRNRVSEVSRLLSEIKDRILGGLGDKEFADYMIKGLRMTAVTAVASTEEGIFSGRSDEGDNAEAKARIEYWQRFAREMAGTDCAFDTNVTKIRATHSTGYLTRRANDSTLEPLVFVMSTRPSNPLRVVSAPGDTEDAYRLFQFLKQHRAKIEEATGGKTHFRIGTERSSQTMLLAPPHKSSGRGTLDLPDNKNAADKVFSWVKGAMPALEHCLASLITEQFDAAEAGDAQAASGPA